jgi:2-oxoisovalerate dehydrogenase E1 component
MKKTEIFASTYIFMTRGHEAIQLATAYQLSKEDWVLLITETNLYYWELVSPYQLMLQLLAKAEDFFRRSFLLFASIQ